MYKYKNISTEGTYNFLEGDKLVEKKGTEKQYKVDGVFKTVLPGEVYDSKVRLNDPEMELVVEKKPVKVQVLKKTDLPKLKELKEDPKGKPSEKKESVVDKLKNKFTKK